MLTQHTESSWVSTWSHGMALIGAMCSELRNKVLTALHPRQPEAQGLEESPLRSHEHAFPIFFLQEHTADQHQHCCSAANPVEPCPSTRHSHLPCCTHSSLSAFASSTEMLLPEPHPSTGAQHPGSPIKPRSLPTPCWSLQCDTVLPHVQLHGDRPTWVGAGTGEDCRAKLGLHKLRLCK